MSIYLDYTASAPVSKEISSIYGESLLIHFANPASMHRLGLEADKLLQESSKKIKRHLGGDKSQLIFTSGGSESINMALKGYIKANQRKPKRIIISQGEHSAVLNSAKFLESEGFELDMVALDQSGTVNLEDLQRALMQPASIMSIIHVSNETGAVNPIEKIAAMRNSLQPDLAIHVDAVQSTGKMPFNFQRLGIDMASGSGHKIGSPKGIGWLLKRKQIRLEPLIHGGGQQYNLRSGTENPPLAAALAAAMDAAITDIEQKILSVSKLKQLYIANLDKYDIRYKIVSPELGVPHILAISFPGINAETMLHALEGKEVYISAGSACSSRLRRKNHVLQAMSLRQEIADSTVRISFAAGTTAEDIEQAAMATFECYKYLVNI